MLVDPHFVLHFVRRRSLDLRDSVDIALSIGDVALDVVVRESSIGSVNVHADALVIVLGQIQQSAGIRIGLGSLKAQAADQNVGHLNAGNHTGVQDGVGIHTGDQLKVQADIAGLFDPLGVSVVLKIADVVVLGYQNADLRGAFALPDGENAGLAQVALHCRLGRNGSGAGGGAGAGAAIVAAGSQRQQHCAAKERGKNFAFFHNVILLNDFGSLYSAGFGAGQNQK